MGKKLETPQRGEWWNEEENRLYIKTNDQWEIWIPVLQRTRRQKFQQTDDTTDQPSGDPVSCTNIRSYKSIQSHTQFPPPAIHEPPPSLKTRIENLPTYKKWSIDHWSLQGSITDVISAIKNKKAMIVSDGSVKDRKGTSCFILTDNEESFQVVGLNRIPGRSKDSQRAELGGIIGAIVWIQTLCKHYNVNNGFIELGLDGDSAIKALERHRLHESDADYDMIWLIKKTLSKIPINIKFRWIKGHQTDFKHISELDIWGRLNEMADKLAKRYWETTKTSPHPCNIQMTPFGLFYNQDWMRTFRSKEIYTELKGDFTGDYWIKRKSPGITQQTIMTIDWSEYHRSTKSTRFGTRLLISKGLAGFAATGEYMAKIYNQPNECPRCGAPEDFRHVLTCPDTEATAIWTTNISKAMDIIRRHISPTSAYITEQYLISWRRNTTISTAVYIPMDLKTLFEDQQKLGWEAFCFGRLSNTWKEFTTSTDSHNNPKRWVYSLITKLCQTIWHMWDHRNSVLHDPAGRVLSLQHTQLNAQIRLEYMIGSLDLHPSDEGLLQKSVDHRCKLPIERKRLWLEEIKRARRYALLSRPSTNNLASPPAINQNNHTHETGLTRWLQSDS